MLPLCGREVWARRISKCTDTCVWLGELLSHQVGLLGKPAGGETPFVVLSMVMRIWANIQTCVVEQRYVGVLNGVGIGVMPDPPHQACDAQ